MYDWPEVAHDVDRLWTAIAHELRERHLDAPSQLTRCDDLEGVWRDPGLLVGQVCSLNPVRDGDGVTAVIGTLVYEPPPGLPSSAPGSYYSVVVGRADDHRGDDPTLAAFAGASLAANGTDSQSGYWSLGHHVRALVDGAGPLFGAARLTGAHRLSIEAVAEGRADLAAIDVHSWRLATEHDPEATRRLRIVTTTDPTPGVVCVCSSELAKHRDTVSDAIDAAVARLETRNPDVLGRLHITGWRPRRTSEFRLVAERVASTRAWHR